MSFAPAGRADPDPRPTSRAFDAERDAVGHSCARTTDRVRSLLWRRQPVDNSACWLDRCVAHVDVYARADDANERLATVRVKLCHVLERMGCTPIMGPSNGARPRAANPLISTQSPAARARSVHDDDGHTVTRLRESDRMSPADSGGSPASFERAATTPGIFGDARRAHNGRRMRAPLVRGDLLGRDSNLQPVDSQCRDDVGRSVTAKDVESRRFLPGAARVVRGGCSRGVRARRVRPRAYRAGSARVDTACSTEPAVLRSDAAGRGCAWATF
jgi:hypothetical protein